MFNIYESNKISILIEKVCDIIQKKPLLNIFEKEIFINDNYILFQWINMFIAKKIGISANLELYHFNHFIWSIFEKTKNKKIKNVYKKSILTWKIMKIIEKNNYFQNIYKINRQINKFNFSFLMGKLFEKYIIYRPEWISSWENKKKALKNCNIEKWQKKLWIEIENYDKQYNQLKYNLAYLINNINAFINENTIKKMNLPHRIFVISSLSLNLAHMKILKKMSNYIDVHFLYITPFKKDVSFSFKKIKKNRMLEKNCLQKKFNNFSFESWGAFENFYIFFIQSFKPKIFNKFKINQENNLLNMIKKDILMSKINMLRGVNINKNKRVFSKKDDSICISICDNKFHEIEILYKKLTLILKNNPNIKPSDIVVISFSMDSYIPSIESIFKSSNKTKNMPFFISNVHSKKTNLILSIFQKILDLKNCRFNNLEILKLLDFEAISKKFEISETEIDTLYSWIKDVNIRWGVNNKHQEDLLLPKNHQNTWLYGIERLLLSYALNDDKYIWDNILPSTFINGSKSQLVGKLVKFINTLEKWRKKLLYPKHLKSWYNLFNDFIDDFFIYDQETEKFIVIIRKSWKNMINDGLLSQYKKKISVNLIIQHFFSLMRKKIKEEFLPGVINFCHPSSILFMPFKVIYNVGCDQSSIPKKNELKNFNLLEKHSLSKDFNAQDKYAYLFLQSISCAKQYFYISYIGKCIKNNTKIYPSIFVDQLFNYILYNFCFKENIKNNSEDNIKKMSNHLIKIYEAKHFYKKKLIINNSYKNFKKYNSLIYNKTIFSEESKNTSVLTDLNLRQLIFFWQNPIRYFFNFKLNIKMHILKKNMSITEPFSINTLEKFRMNHLILKTIIYKKSTEKLFQYYSLSGILPYGNFGKVHWNQQKKEMENIAKLVSKFKNSNKKEQFNLKINKYHLIGTLKEIQKTGLLRWKPNKINYSDRVSLWLEHLIYCALGNVGSSIIVGYKNEVWSFSPIKPKIACNYLSFYMSGYIKGMHKPLWLTRSGICWLDKVYDKKNDCIVQDESEIKKGRDAIFKTWRGDDYIKGEKEDIYIQKIILELNTKNIKKICNTAEKWMIPMLRHQE
ncbi:exodeoxyribonuclease V subunit gamma [Buchnera aphidicola (Muscaphis stroyani)]|uniref:RecBCD enzyme subunit RecC n=1 Tax=Buchnera aphidicola (Muscaphis stroyani) TaxID=1241869 RepID=A0A4D6Y528_9GAMM|nr:exodeoxyribonuclease V subunit gamma [Buchnera aphidicola]QCI24497.1 exodeoxyribonuclease V subunit gamma [Buchnera aphidicola (Muscaphis stroyani)]